MDVSKCCQAPVDVAGDTTQCQQCHQPCDTLLKLTCEGCGTVATFASPEQAFDLGWDCPPMFTQIVTCSRCSSAELLIAQEQAKQN